MNVGQIFDTVYQSKYSADTRKQQPGWLVPIEFYLQRNKCRLGLACPTSLYYPHSVGTSIVLWAVTSGAYSIGPTASIAGSVITSSISALALRDKSVFIFKIMQFRLFPIHFSPLGKLHG